MCYERVACKCMYVLIAGFSAKRNNKNTRAAVMHGDDDGQDYEE